MASLSIHKHNSADCVVLSDVAYTDRVEIKNMDAAEMGEITFSIQDLANSEFFKEKLRPADSASFIGFPGRDSNHVWYDEEWQMPIVRTIQIASHPATPFSNSQISTSDVILVSGLSFAGSSGSPIISHAKIYTTNNLKSLSYTSPSIIGIMSGHWNDSGQEAFPHSGLSYLTRSTAIIELLDACERSAQAAT